ncbi:MAG: DUF3237 domain-containing protein [Actinomycetia bacterium]|nr:DUF3237 domain-containing protein [Actinomycetes bacterium]MCP4085561.1 DUF3237 domain-containing protein [Actinomycetes bacterium]
MTAPQPDQTEETLPVEFLFEMSLSIGEERAVVRRGPHGTRAVASVTGGQVTGPKVNATVFPVAAGDWVTVRGGGVVHIDVRLTLETDDGAIIQVSYNGIGQAHEDGTTSIRTAPTFEVGDERYTWLNAIQAVGVGTATHDSVTYRVYRLL